MRARFLALALLLVPLSASARFHLWQITEVYSNANGSVQFVEAEVVNPTDNEDLTAGKNLTSSTTTFTIPSNLPTTTVTHFLLFATPAFASQPGCTNVVPDFTLAGPNFMSTIGADLINFANVNSFSYTGGELPTGGVQSLNEPFNSNVRTTAVNSPTNFAGQTCQLPEPSGWLGMLAGTATVFGLARGRGRRWDSLLRRHRSPPRRRSTSGISPRSIPNADRGVQFVELINPFDGEGFHRR